MAFCTNCGTKLEDGDKFCLICGYAVKAKEGKNLDIIIEKSVRLKGTKDDKTEISVFVPQRNRNYQILIPNSIEVGQSVRLRGEGLSDAGNRKGDLLVKITGIEYLDTELTTSVVLFGSEDGVTKIPVFLPHARKTVQVSIPNNINADQTLRLKGLGLRNERGEAGDLFLHFDHVNYTKEEDQPVPPPPQAEQQSTYTERKQEYAGKIIKCPACGEVIQSFTAVCPSCGHEINSQTVSFAVKQFVEAINECDAAIANDPEQTRRNGTLGQPVFKLRG